MILYKRGYYAWAILPCSERHQGAIVDPGYLKTRVARRDIFPGRQLARSAFSTPGTTRGVPDPTATACAPGSEFNPVPMVIADKVIRKGTLGHMVLSTKLAHPQAVPCLWRWQGAITSPAYLKGRVAERDIFAGQQLTRSQFS